MVGGVALRANAIRGVFMTNGCSLIGNSAGNGLGGQSSVYQFYNAAIDKYLYTADENEGNADVRSAYGYAYQALVLCMRGNESVSLGKCVGGSVEPVPAVQ